MPEPDDEIDQVMRRLQQSLDEQEAREAERRGNWQRAKAEAEAFIGRKLAEHRATRGGDEH